MYVVRLYVHHGNDEQDGKEERAMSLYLDGRIWIHATPLVTSCMLVTSFRGKQQLVILWNLMGKSSSRSKKSGIRSCTDMRKKWSSASVAGLTWLLFASKGDRRRFLGVRFSNLSSKFPSRDWNGLGLSFCEMMSFWETKEMRSTHGIERFIPELLELMSIDVLGL